MLLAEFLRLASEIDKPSVLELGTYRSNPEISTLHKEWVPHAFIYHGTDIFMGQDVDFIADVHKLSEVAGVETYDIIISCSSFEHFKYPQVAAFEVSKVLSPNGLVFVQTHQSYPLHAYPYDFFRFSTEALSACFGTRNGIKELGTQYQFSCSIKSERQGDTPGGFLNTLYLGQKTHKTPEQYQYDF